VVDGLKHDQKQHHLLWRYEISIYTQINIHKQKAKHPYGPTQETRKQQTPGFYLTAAVMIHNFVNAKASIKKI